MQKLVQVEQFGWMCCHSTFVNQFTLSVFCRSLRCMYCVNVSHAPLVTGLIELACDTRCGLVLRRVDMHTNIHTYIVSSSCVACLFDWFVSSFGCLFVRISLALCLCSF
jgi:hypothetical protein